MACCKISKKAAKITLGISIVVLFISIGMIIVFRKIYDAVLKQDLALEKGTLATKIWEDIPLPIYEKLYFFNITNQDAFLEGRELLNVTEVGPYTFKSRWVKPKLQWNNNHTVSYREIRTYHFMPDMSSGTEDDFIYTLNGPMIIGANLVPYIMRVPFDLFCVGKKENVITKKSIRELAYEGYKDAIIDWASVLIHNLPYKHGMFSWLYGKNASDDGLFTVFTGSDDQSKTDIINNWNGEEKLSFWTDDTCNMINGTSIEVGPPINGHQDSYTFFQSFFCRSVTFNYTEDVEHFDIPAKRFKPTYDLFANSTDNPDNYCFEPKKERHSGILDISPCQFGAPVFISFPHFYLAHGSYLESVNGLNPEEDKHGSHIDVEPITGISIDLVVRFQINVEIKKITGFHFFNKVKKGVFPVFWAELSLNIDEDLASFLKRNVRYPKIIAYALLGALFLLSWVGVIVSIIVLCGSKSDEDDPLIAAKSDTRKCCGYQQNNECTVEEKINTCKTDKSSTDDTQVLGNKLNESSIQEESPVYQ